MKQRYGKLVRDRIPELIRANGEMPNTRTMDSDEYRRELLYKLIEESEELQRAGHNPTDAEFLAELADVAEVFDAVLDEFDIKREVLDEMRAKRADERGRFKDQLFLESVQ